MSRTVTLPPGCAGFTMEDGTQYRGREGQHVTVRDEHAPFIERQVGGDAQRISSALDSADFSFGTSAFGRSCGGFRWI